MIVAVHGRGGGYQVTTTSMSWLSSWSAARISTTVRGTHLGELWDLPPTGKRVELALAQSACLAGAMQVLELAGGERWMAPHGLGGVPGEGAGDIHPVRGFQEDDPSATTLPCLTTIKLCISMSGRSSTASRKLRIAAGSTC
jgi:hypothetical protein